VDLQLRLDRRNREAPTPSASVVPRSEAPVNCGEDGCLCCAEESPAVAALRRWLARQERAEQARRAYLAELALQERSEPEPDDS
jgi:hypothetical protein